VFLGYLSVLVTVYLKDKVYVAVAWLHVLCSVIYLTCTMALGALSVCFTVLVLNLHHRDNERPVPAWAQTLVLDYLASLLCVARNQLHQRTAQNTEQAIPPEEVNVS